MIKIDNNTLYTLKRKIIISNNKSLTLTLKLKNISLQDEVVQKCLSESLLELISDMGIKIVLP